MLADHAPDACHAPACQREAASGHLLCWDHWDGVEAGLRNRCWSCWLAIREGVAANLGTAALVDAYRAWTNATAQVMANINQIARSDGARRTAP